MLALSIWGSQEIKQRHAPRLSVAILGSLEIVELLLYYGKKSEYSPRAFSICGPAGDTLCPNAIT